MARKTTLGDALRKTEPTTEAPAPEAVQAPVAAPAAPSGREAKPVRSTLDLTPERHAEFQRWATDATLRVGRSVRGQQVLRALVARLLVDEQLAEAITEDLRNTRP